MTPPPAWRIESGVPGIAWPAVPYGNAAIVLSLLQQLEQTQWLPSEAILERQRVQLEALLRHAHATVPFYRERWAGAYDGDVPLTMERFAQLPLLTRRELQENYAALRSASPPAAHGAIREGRTSGSIGAPVRFLSTELGALFWAALTLRDHLWHGRDLSAKLAVIRRETERGTADNWGPATAGLARTGPSVTNSIFADAEAQLDWLEAEQPAYVFTYPTLVREMARIALRRGTRLDGLRELRTLAESLDPDLRALCREAWGVPLTDLYSASETGYLALQCPAHEHYHVQSESVLLEVLDEAGAPCGPGQVGRVVATPLHSFAMPLIRYDVGDYAEVGEPCACGRGLPVLRRILGRVRNALVAADGRKYWPVFGTRALIEETAVRQYQFAQTSLDLIEARLVVEARLTPQQETRFRERVLSMLPAGMTLRFAYVSSLPRSPGGKFEEFVSELSAALR